MALEKPASSRRGGGSVENTWEQLAVTWVRVSPMRGQDRFEGQQAEEIVTHRIEFRASVDVTGKLRLRPLRESGRILHIVSAHKPENHGNLWVGEAREERA